jgi:hypothetical protein
VETDLSVYAAVDWSAAVSVKSDSVMRAWRISIWLQLFKMIAYCVFVWLMLLNDYRVILF